MKLPNIVAAAAVLSAATLPVLCHAQGLPTSQADMDKQLGITATQKTQLAGVQKKYKPQVDALQKKYQAKFMALQKQFLAEAKPLNDKITKENNNILTAKQLAQMKAWQQAAMQQRAVGGGMGGAMGGMMGGGKP